MERIIIDILFFDFATINFFNVDLIIGKISAINGINPGKPYKKLNKLRFCTREKVACTASNEVISKVS
jgi:hypothetical protein